jgi:oxygen-independent coproporphyrinogen III oxidase
MPTSCKKNHRSGAAWSARSLYVHVPLCAGKCGYCDFYSVPFTADRAARYVAGVRAELTRQGEALAAPLESVFVGGGTPSILPAGLAGELAGAIAPLADGATEWTIEANPSSLDEARLAAWQAAGVNRVSLGVQTLGPGELAVLGRARQAGDVERAVALLGRAGVANWNLDLIYGIPGQTLASWSQTLEAAIGFGPSHVSCYALGIEPGTELMARVWAGEIVPADEELQRAMYYHAVDALAAAGLEHYELSNFALPGRACAHNVSCWQGGSYLGLGPAAASHLHGVRRGNRADFDGWAEAVLAGRDAPADEDRPGAGARIGEALMLALRLIEGAGEAAFAQRFGLTVDEAVPQSLARHLAGGLIERSGGRVRLSRAGWFLADTVLADCIEETQHLDAPPAGR